MSFQIFMVSDDEQDSCDQPESPTFNVEHSNDENDSIFEQHWKPAQSLELSKIFMNACLALVLLQRVIIRGSDWVVERSFDDVFLDNGVNTYESIINDIDTDIRTESSHKFPMLRRGVKENVDNIIHALHQGVFPALSQGELYALQVCVIPDKHAQHEVLECYTFHIDHLPSTRDRTCSIGGNEASGNFLALDARANLVRSFSALKKSIRPDLPALPRERYLSFNLFLFNYQTYSVADYKLLHDFALRYPKRDAQGREWHMHRETLPTQHSGHHDVDFYISLPERDLTSTRERDLPIPQNFEEWSLSDRRSPFPRVNRSGLPLPRDSLDKRDTAVSETPNSTALAVTPSQIRRDRVIRETLNKMQKTSSAPAALEPTQACRSNASLDVSNGAATLCRRGFNSSLKGSDNLLSRSKMNETNSGKARNSPIPHQCNPVSAFQIHESIDVALPSDTASMESNGVRTNTKTPRSAALGLMSMPNDELWEEVAYVYN